MNEPEAQPAAAPPLVQLTALEARVLGCLIEKAATTPEVYPLTLNAAHLACNQKSNRDPIMAAELGAVGQALRTLEDKRLVRVVHGARALRYEHTIDAALNLMARPRAVIALLLLRGDTIDRLIARDPPLVVRIGRASGQREDRYMHLLSGPVSIESLPAHVSRAEGPGKGDRYAELEARVEALESTVAALQARLGASDKADQQ
jgi:uncharacterized protein YceH (UPF0502 family)